MRKFLVFVCFFVSFGVLSGCDLTKLPDAIFEDERDLERHKSENVTFVEAVFNEPIREFDADTEPAESDGNFEEDFKSDVDCGLAVWQVTEKNRFYVYHKFGINTTGVIIFESKNSDELRFGDKIVRINDTEIKSARDIGKTIAGYQVGDVIKVEVLRDGKTITVDLTLTRRVPCGVTFK